MCVSSKYESDSVPALWDLCILDKFFTVTICVSVLNMSLILYQHCGDLCILVKIFYCNHLCVSSKYESDSVPALWDLCILDKFFIVTICVSVLNMRLILYQHCGDLCILDYFLL